MVEVQNPKDGKWYPYPQNDWYNGNIRVDGGQAMSHEMYQQTYPAEETTPEAPVAPTAPTTPTGTQSPNYNNGSPPDRPLQDGYGWEFNGNDWVQVQGRGAGYNPPAAATTGGNVSGNNGSGGGAVAAPSTPMSPGNTPTGGGNGGGNNGNGNGNYVPTTYDDAAADALLLGEDPGAMPEWTAPTWQAPANFAYDKTFTAPTEQTLMADPSYQFRLSQGQKALENSAAGKGLLRSGGTLKDLVDYGQNFATNEYSNVYNRGFNEYKFDFDKSADIWTKNYGKSKDEFDKMYKSKFDEFSPKLTGWQTKTNNRARGAETIVDRNWRRGASDQDRWSNNANAAADRALKLRQIEQDDVY